MDIINFIKNYIVFLGGLLIEIYKRGEFILDGMIVRNKI